MAESKIPLSSLHYVEATLNPPSWTQQSYCFKYSVSLSSAFGRNDIKDVLPIYYSGTNSPVCAGIDGTNMYLLIFGAPSSSTTVKVRGFY